MGTTNGSRKKVPLSQADLALLVSLVDRGAPTIAREDWQAARDAAKRDAGLLLPLYPPWSRLEKARRQGEIKSARHKYGNMLARLVRVAAIRVTAIAMLLALAGSVHANQAKGKPAPDLFVEAKKAYNLGQFRFAAEAFERVYAATSNPVMLWNAAQAARFFDRPKALRMYRSFLREKPEEPLRGLAVAKVKELESTGADVDASARTDSDVEDPFEFMNVAAPKKAVPSAPQPQAAPNITVQMIMPAQAAAPAPAPDRPVYQRPLFWGVVGGIVLAAVVGVAIVEGRHVEAPIGGQVDPGVVVVR